MTTIISSIVRHRVQFAPDPNNRSFPTKPQFTETRLVRDVAEYPEGVNYISFHDVVVTEVRLPNGKTQTLISEPVNDSGVYHIQWKAPVPKLPSPTFNGPVPVHPDVAGKVFVRVSSQSQLAEQGPFEGQAWDKFAGAD
jgi:hypothetical protein